MSPFPEIPNASLSLSLSTPPTKPLQTLSPPLHFLQVSFCLSYTPAAAQSDYPQNYCRLPLVKFLALLCALFLSGGIAKWVLRSRSSDGGGDEEMMDSLS